MALPILSAGLVDITEAMGLVDNDQVPFRLGHIRLLGAGELPKDVLRQRLEQRHVLLETPSRRTVMCSTFPTA